MNESDGTTMLVLVRSAADLASACREVGDFLVFRARRYGQPGAQEYPVGFWVDPGMVADVPQRLGGGEELGNQPQLVVRESLSPGPWVLCWVVPEAGACHGETAYDYLIPALIETARSKGTSARACRFSPVFSIRTPPARLRAAMKTLRERYPRQIGPPVFQDAAGGLFLAQARAGA